MKKKLLAVVLVAAVVIGGRQLWRIAVVSSGDGASSAAVADDRGAGRTGWRLEVPGWVGALAGDDALVAAVSANSVVTALDPGSGSPLWAHELGDLSADRPALSEEQVIVRGRERVVVLDRGDGSPLWEAPMVGPGPVAWSDASDEGSGDGSGDGVVIAGSWDGTLSAFEQGTGTRRWSKQRPGGLRSVPVGVPTAAPGTDGLVVAVWHGERAASIVALRTADGGVVWERELGAAASAPAVGGGTVGVLAVVGDGRGGVLALDPEDGRPLWNAPVGAGFTTDVAPVVDGAHVIVADRLGVVHALNTSDGVEDWSRDLGVPVLRGAPTVTGRQVVVTTSDGRAVALERADGGLVDVSDADAFVVATAYGGGHLVTGLRLTGPGRLEGVATR